MREKIQRAILQYISASKAQMIHSHDDVFLTDKILALISEEIQKVENPYDSDIQGYHWVGWQVAHKKILDLLK